MTTPLLLTSSIIELNANDCACATNTYSNKIQDNFTGYFKAVPENSDTILSDEFVLLFNPIAPTNPNILNQSAWQRYQTFTQQVQLLSQPIDYQLAQQRLIVPINQKITIKPPIHDTLTVWLHVTNACNLACTYCYVHKTSEQMSEITGLNVIEKIVQYALEHQFENVKLKFAGGEPLLNFKLIQTLYSYTQTLTQQNNLNLQAVILTNGTCLTPDIAFWIKQHAIQLMLSIDGLQTIHDAQRPAKNAQSNFKQLEHHLIHTLLPLGIKPHISITVTQQNASTLKDTVQWAIEYELPFSFNFYRRNSHSSSYATLQLEEIQIIEGVKATYQVIEQYLPDYLLNYSLLDRMQSFAHTHTCGVGQNYIVVTHTGQFAQCHMLLDQTSPVIQNLSVDEKEDCRDCAFRYYCTGGCPLETYYATGRWDTKSPHCMIYKTLFPELLRLEGLRLVKFNQES